MLLEHELYSGLGMDALVIVCSGNTNVIMVWASGERDLVSRFINPLTHTITLVLLTINLLTKSP